LTDLGFQVILSQIGCLIGAEIAVLPIFNKMVGKLTNNIGKEKYASGLE